MTGRLGFTAADHDRACELAAQRLDDPLLPSDARWLDAHLAACNACAGVAAEFDEQRLAFRALRDLAPDPPRDLWARTSAAIEAERARPSGLAGVRRAFAMPRGSRRLSVAPVAAAVIVVVAVSAGLLNGRLVVPGGAPEPTPIALAAADVQVLGRDSAGNVQILSRPLDAVCPVGVATCGVSPTFAVTSVNGFSATSQLNGTLSPTHDRMVVVAHGAGGEGIYVVPVSKVSVAGTPPPVVTPAPVGSATAATPPPSSSATPSSPATPAASATPGATSATPAASPESVGSTPPAATATPDAASASPAASAEPIGSTPPTASASPAPLASPSDTPPPAATAAPSVTVTPASDTAIRIASGVTVVGGPVYAPDGVHLAFSAMPSDGSTGPDVYVWATGDKTARAITSDHGSWLADWTADGILVSRVSNGDPSTFLLDPAKGRATPVGADMTWLPAIAPSGATAAWWAGTVKLAADGVTWVPDNGRLVLGVWPDAAGAAAPQVLAKGPITDWQVSWDETGSVVAVWLGGSANSRSGRLSLDRLDPATGLADLANPMLDSAPAAPGFSLRSGRLAWTAPVVGDPQVVEVLAWEGKTIGRLELPANGSGTVVP